MEKKESALNSAVAKTTVPVVIDLGKQKRKNIKKLENGEGKLMLEIDLAVEHARARLPEEDKNKIIVPVVVIYERKPKRGLFPTFPFSPFDLLR